jgi:hypothetical protein
MQFSEANEPWRAIPPWAEFLIHSGLTLGNPKDGDRRIIVISMPCESAAAGLLTLGAICRRLAIEGANDSNSHFQRIDRLAAKSIAGIFLRHDTQLGRFLLEGKDKDGLIWVRSEKASGSRQTKRTRRAIFPWTAREWRFNGEAPVIAADGSGLPDRDFYREASGAGWLPVESNFNQSDSGVCLAGRVSGESVSKSIMEGTQFMCGSLTVDLARLLTIQNWSPGAISRATFFNTRTGELDRNTGMTRLVIADGDSAFLRVLEGCVFQNCDVIGVIHRVVDRDRLEAIGVKITDLGQWYAPEVSPSNGLPKPPDGITILKLKRR